MRHTVAFATAAMFCTAAALAQSQQAGNDASTNADETFKKLIEKCDNTDALVLRARIRLATGRLDDGSFDDLIKEMNTGLSQCGDGKIEEAMVTLKKTLATADKRVSDKFGQEGDTANVKADPGGSDNQQQGSAEGGAGDKMAGEDKKPWWKFW
jgi:hypothetical protein